MHRRSADRGRIRGGAGEGGVLRRRDPEEGLLEVDRGASVLLGDGTRVEIREDSRLRLPRSARAISRPGEGFPGRGRAYVPARARRRGLHRYGGEALTPSLHRLVPRARTGGECELFGGGLGCGGFVVRPGNG